MLPKFIFIHIPKTAGTSFKENILKPLYKNKFYYDKFIGLSTKKRAYSLKNNLILYNWETFVFPDNYENYDVIGGHFTFDKYKHLNLPIITFLRDPVERMISHYYFYREASKIYMNKSIIEFSKIYANFMTSQLGSNVDSLYFVGFTEYYDESIKVFADKFELELPKNKNKKHRESKSAHIITSEDRKIIKKINKEDYRLYQNALDKFNKENTIC